MSVYRVSACYRSCIGIMSVFFLMIRRPPRSTQSRSSAASDVYKRQLQHHRDAVADRKRQVVDAAQQVGRALLGVAAQFLSLIHISEPTRLLSISYAVFCLKKKILTCPYTLPP